MNRPVWFAAACALLPALAIAQVPTKGPREIQSPISDHFYVRGSYFSANVTTLARQDPTAVQVGTEVNGESDLGFDDKIDQGRMELGFRFHDKHRLRVDYFKLNRSGDKRLTRQIVFDTTTYNINDRVQTLADLRLLGFTYTWSFLHTTRFEAGVGLGLHLVNAETEGRVAARNIRENGTVGAAFPTVALDGAWRVSRRWAVTARAQLLKLNVSDVDGEFADYHLDFQYRWQPNVAFGLGYSSIGINAVSSDVNNPGRFKLETKGPEAFFRVSF
jgi:hypothetical protein